MTDIDPEVVEFYLHSATIVVDVERLGPFKWDARVYDDFGFFDVRRTFLTKRKAKKFVFSNLEEIEEVLNRSGQSGG